MAELSWDLNNEEFILGMFSSKREKHVQRASDNKEYYLFKDLKAGQHDWSKEIKGEGKGWASHAVDCECLQTKLRTLVIIIRAKQKKRNYR